MTNRKREHLRQVWLSDTEDIKLSQICDREEKNHSEMLRDLIRREWQKIFGEKEGRNESKSL